MPGAFGYKKCCCVGDTCCSLAGAGTRDIGSGTQPVSPACVAIIENDDYDLVGGVTGTSTLGVGVVITGTTESRTLGIDWSADIGDIGDIILVSTGSGPIRIEFTPPAGKRVCAVRFGVTMNYPGTINTWSATVTDTGGTLTTTGNSVTTSAITGFCTLNDGAFQAFSAAGEGITSVEVSHGGHPGDDYIGIGHLAICLVNSTVPSGARLLEGGVVRRFEDNTYRIME